MTKSKSEKIIPEYCFVENDSWDFSAIKILEGPFHDMIYKYGKVMFGAEETGNDKLTTKFEYVIIEYPHHESLIQDNMEQFENCLGDILIDIISDEMMKKEAKGTSYESRDINTKELTTH